MPIFDSVNPYAPCGAFPLTDANRVPTRPTLDFIGFFSPRRQKCGDKAAEAAMTDGSFCRLLVVNARISLADAKQFVPQS